MYIHLLKVDEDEQEHGDQHEERDAEEGELVIVQLERQQKTITTTRSHTGKYRNTEPRTPIACICMEQQTHIYTCIYTQRGTHKSDKSVWIERDTCTYKYIYIYIYILYKYIYCYSLEQSEKRKEISLMKHQNCIKLDKIAFLQKKLVLKTSFEWICHCLIRNHAHLYTYRRICRNTNRGIRRERQTDTHTTHTHQIET